MLPLTITIDLNPNLFSAGPFQISWHGVFSVLGIFAAARIGAYLAARDGISKERIYDMAVWMVVAGIVGARLLFVWENYQHFQGSWIRVFYLTEGGISQWGGIFGALLGGYLWCRRNHVDFLRIVDAAGAANALGFAIGRIGDIINGEHHAIGSNLPWAVDYVNEKTLGQPGRSVHPEVAYEMIFDLLLVAALLPFHQRLKQRLPPGVLGLIYFALYSIGRFLLSFLREDSLLYGLRQAQWASVIMVAIAVVGIPYLLVKRRSGSSPVAPQEAAA